MLTFMDTTNQTYMHTYILLETFVPFYHGLTISALIWCTRGKTV